MQKARQKFLPRHRTWIILESSSGACFCSTFNGRLRWARAGLGSMAISCAVCSLQRAVCSVCVHDRHRCLHEHALTSCDRMALTSLQLPPRTPPPKAPPHFQTLHAGDRQQADDHLRQFLFLSMCCRLRCGSSCSGPRFPPGARAAQRRDQTPKRRRVTARMVNSAGTDRVLAIPEVRGRRCCDR